MPLGNLELPQLPALDRAQPALAMTQTIAARGACPEPGGSALNTIGMIQSFAGNYEPFDAFPCAGERFADVQYKELAALVGFNYGGTPGISFGVPDLRGRTAIGGDLSQSSLDQTIFSTNGTVTVTYMIAAEGSATGTAAWPMTGAIGMFTGNDPPGGWLPADGRLLPIEPNAALFATIGNAFGGDGQASFALPNLTGRAPVGAGGGGRLAQVQIGETVAGVPGGVPGLGLTYLINVGGAVPPRTGDGIMAATLSMLGQVTAFAGSAIPEGWEAAAGQMLSVAQNRPLFSILGATFGGDGQTRFALPDLRGRMMTGADNMRPLYGATGAGAAPARRARAGRAPAPRPKPLA